MSQLDVTVKEVETGGVETLVDQGEADLGLCHHPRHTRLTRTDVLGSDELVLIGRDDVLSGVPSPDDLSALASIPLLLWPRDNHPEYFDSLVSLCRTRGLSPLLLIGADRLSGAPLPADAGPSCQHRPARRRPGARVGPGAPATRRRRAGTTGGGPAALPRPGGPRRRRPGARAARGRTDPARARGVYSRKEATPVTTARDRHVKHDSQAGASPVNFERT